jgi:hypothetical protein
MAMKRRLSWWRGLLALVAVVAVALALVGCNGLGPPATEPAKTEVPFETITKGDLVLHQEQGPAFAPSYEDMDLMIAIDPAEAQQIADELSPKRPGLRFDEIASVDYEEYLVVAAYFGAKPSAGYEITIERIAQVAHEVDVIVRLVEPRVGTAIFTYPIHAVKIKKTALTTKGPLTFVLMEGNKVLLKREHSVP